MNRRTRRDAAEEPQVRDTNETPEPGEASKTSGAPEKKSGRPAPLFVYLAVLFAAAFLMLLLAYFVQQRNSETTIDDLRSSMTATREELMAANQTLQTERDGLEAELEQLQGAQQELQQKYDALDQQSREENEQHLMEKKDMINQVANWEDFWRLDQAFREKDYDACTEFFHGAMISNYYATPPEAAERVEEIYTRLVDMGELDEDTPLPIIRD